MNTPAKTKDYPTWINLVILIGLLVVAVAGIRTISLCGNWMHLASGRWIAQNGIPSAAQADPFSFTQPENPWINTTWLYDVFAYGVYQAGGAGALILVHVAIVLAAFLILMRLARSWSGPIGIGLGLLLCAWILAPRFDVRPIMVGMLMASIFLVLPANNRSAGLLWIVLLPLQVLWANMHPSFLLGPAILLLYGWQTIYEARTPGASFSDLPEAVRKRSIMFLALALGCLLVTLVNPFGVQLHQTAIRICTDPSYDYVQEWISPFSLFFLASPSRHIVMLVLLIGAAGLITQRKRLPVVITAVAVVSAFIIVLSIRYIDSFAFLAFPFLCLSLSAIGSFITEQVRARKDSQRMALHAVAALVVIVLSLWTAWNFIFNRYYIREGSASGFGLGIEEDIVPAEVADIVSQDGFPERMLNLALDGGYLVWSNPDRQVFTDQRAGLYGLAFHKELFEGLQRGIPESRQALIDRWFPDAILINACDRNAGKAARPLLADGRWTLCYFDGTSALFIQPKQEYAPWINNPELMKSGLEQIDNDLQAYQNALGNVIAPPVPPRLVGAGNMFMSLGRFEEALAIYQALTRGAPAMSYAWLNLGICQLELEQTEQALASLTAATEMLPKNAYSWLCLSRALAQNDQPNDARQAYERAKSINADTARAFGNPLED